MNGRLRAYIALVAVAAVALVATHVPASLADHWAHYVAWIVVCVVSDTLWLSVGGASTLSLSSTAGLAAMVLWGVDAGIVIAFVCTLLSEFFVLRKPWYRAIFNAGQITITFSIAGLVLVGLGGPANGLEHAAPFDRGTASALRLGVPVLAMCFAYWFVNRLLVVRAVSWASGRGYWRVWKEDWLPAHRLVVDAATFLLSPLMIISYHAIGYPGVVLFYAPLFMIHESDRRYSELRKAQEEQLKTAAFVAKGELAARTGHELNNRLVAILARAQMLLADSKKDKYDSVAKYAEIIYEQAQQMKVMADGLMSYTRSEVHVEPMDMNALISNTIEFLRADKRLNGIEWKVELDPSLPQLKVDVGQMQSVLINLFVNAADAMNGQAGTRAIHVTTCLEERARSARIEVKDTGPGIKTENLPRMFEFMFTTKPTGHGFGLATAQRTVQMHGGRIKVESPTGEGAHFTIQLPVAGPGGLR